MFSNSYQSFRASCLYFKKPLEKGYFLGFWPPIRNAYMIYRMLCVRIFAKCTDLDATLSFRNLFLWENLGWREHSIAVFRSTLLPNCRSRSHLCIINFFSFSTSIWRYLCSGQVTINKRYSMTFTNFILKWALKIFGSYSKLKLPVRFCMSRKRCEKLSSVIKYTFERHLSFNLIDP